VLPTAVVVAGSLVGLARQTPGRALVHLSAAVVPGGLLLAWVLVPVLRTPAGSEQPFIGTLETYGSTLWQLSNMVHREFDTTGHGVVRYPWPNGVYYAVALGHPFLLTPLLAVLALPGAVAVWRLRHWTAMVVLVGWILPMYLFHAGSTWQNLRYVLAYLPPVAIVAAVGGRELVRTADRSDRRAGWLARGWIGAGLVWAALGGPVLTDRFIEQKNGDLATVSWVEATTPPEAQLLTFGPTLVFQHYGQRQTHDLFEVTSSDLITIVADGRPTYVLVDLATIENQWRDRAPDLNYRWLRDHAGLEEIGQRAGQTLFRVSHTNGS
jgi:4-amino-4-deoxy-L-arabinose transferase-like glycosyltransferase